MAKATVESPSTILPDELMIELLFRVESSNPFQLRCVCKLWNSLILDPQFMKKHVGRSLTEIKDLHNKAKEHYIAFKSQIVGNNPIMPQEQVDGDDHEDEDDYDDDEDEDEEAAEEGDEEEEGNEQVDGDDDEDDDEDEEAAEEGDEAEEGNEQVDGDDHEDEDEEAAEEEGDEAEEGNDNEEGKEEDAEEEDKEKKLLMNIVARLDVVLGNVVGQLNILDTIKVSQLDDMLVKTIRANLLAQLDRVKCLKSFLEVYLESPTSSFSSS